MILGGRRISAMPAMALFCGSVFGTNDGGPEIKVLSNRADLISGGDALVEIKWEAVAHAKSAQIRLDGVDVRSAFATAPQRALHGCGHRPEERRQPPDRTRRRGRRADHHHQPPGRRARILGRPAACALDLRSRTVHARYRDRSKRLEPYGYGEHQSKRLVYGSFRRPVQYGDRLSVLLPAEGQRRHGMHVHDHGGQSLLRVLPADQRSGQPAGRRRHRRLHERPRRHREEPDPGREGHDQPEPLFARHVLRSRSAVGSVGAAEGLERQSDVEDGRRHLGQSL